MAGLVVIAERRERNRAPRIIAISAPESGTTITAPCFLGSLALECAMYDKARTLLQSARNPRCAMIDENTGQSWVGGSWIGGNMDAEIIRLSRRYLALRRVAVKGTGGDWIEGDELDADADQLLEGGNEETMV